MHPDSPIDRSLPTLDSKDSPSVEVHPVENEESSTPTINLVDTAPEAHIDPTGASSDDQANVVDASPSSPQDQDTKEAHLPLGRDAIRDIEQYLIKELDPNSDSFVSEAGKLSLLGLEAQFDIQSLKSHIQSSKPQRLVGTLEALNEGILALFQVTLRN